MEYLVFFALGAFVGSFGALVGIGGGLFILPFFIYFMSEGCIFPYFHQATEIVGTSMLVVVINAISGTLAYIRQKKIFFKAGIPFAIATMPGAFLGSYVADSFTGAKLTLYFGCFLLIVASILMFNSFKKARSEEGFDPETFKFSTTFGVCCSLIVGFIASVFGVGGGIIHVPMMIYILKFPTHVAVATSVFILMITSLFGLASHAYLGHIVWLPGFCVGAGAFIGAQIGALISSKTKSNTIVRLLACMTYLLAFKMILSNI